MRVVLDTNVVLSALLFATGRLTWIRHAWREGRIRPVACRETVEELLRVLAYPRFKLTPQEIDELLADFLPFAETARLPKKPPPVPKCRDPHDQVFLILAASARVDALVTGDADLLAVKEAFSRPILTADEFAVIVPGNQK